MDPSLKKDKKFILEILNDDTFYSVIDEIDQSLYKDRNFVLAIAKYDISAIKYTSLY